jgi:hypothetical protein
MKIDWKPIHIPILSLMKMPFDYTDDMTDEQLEQLYDVIPDYLEFDENGDPTKECEIVEEILTFTGKEMGRRGLLA